MIRNVRRFAAMIIVLISTSVLGSGESNLIDVANDFQDRVTALAENICPGSSSMLEAPAPITTRESAIEFFNDDATLHEFEALLGMPEAESFKAAIEALKTLFERGKKQAETPPPSAE